MRLFREGNRRLNIFGEVKGRVWCCPETCSSYTVLCRLKSLSFAYITCRGRSRFRIAKSWRGSSHQSIHGCWVIWDWHWVADASLGKIHELAGALIAGLQSRQISCASLHATGCHCNPLQNLRCENLHISILFLFRFASSYMSIQWTVWNQLLKSLQWSPQINVAHCASNSQMICQASGYSRSKGLKIISRKTHYSVMVRSVLPRILAKCNKVNTKRDVKNLTHQRTWHTIS